MAIAPRKNLPCPVYTIVKGDNRSKSIAAAAILAKTHRDSLMEDLHRRHPHYGWDANVGYPTLHHRTAIQEHGITPASPKNFRPRTRIYRTKNCLICLTI